MDQDAELPLYERWVSWLTPLTDHIRATAPDDPAGALGRLAGGGVDGARAAVVVLREILGRDIVGPDEALTRVLAGHDRWAAWRSHPDLWPRILDGMDRPAVDGEGGAHP
jgi:hypothetical protein